MNFASLDLPTVELHELTGPMRAIWTLARDARATWIENMGWDVISGFEVPLSRRHRGFCALLRHHVAEHQHAIGRSPQQRLRVRAFSIAHSVSITTTNVRPFTASAKRLVAELEDSLFRWPGSTSPVEDAAARSGLVTRRRGDSHLAIVAEPELGEPPATEEVMTRDRWLRVLIEGLLACAQHAAEFAEQAERSEDGVDMAHQEVADWSRRLSEIVSPLG
jgi:hypothetical protein